MTSYQYRKSHCGDKTIWRPSYLHNGISYTIGNPIVEIRRSDDRLISTMGFPILVRWHLRYWIGAQAVIWTNADISPKVRCYGEPTWEPFIMTSSNGNIFRVSGPLCGKFTGPGEFPIQRPVTRSFGVFFDPRLNKRLSKQPWGWWFETPSWSLWRQCNVSRDPHELRPQHVFRDYIFNISATSPRSQKVISLIRRFMGPTWGPSGSTRTQVGPMLAPWTLLPGYLLDIMIAYT